MYELDRDLVSSFQQITEDYGALKFSHLLILALFKNTAMKSTEISKLTGVDSAVCRTIKMRKSNVEITWNEIERINDFFYQLLKLKRGIKEDFTTSIATKGKVSRKKAIKFRTDTELQNKLLNDMSIAELIEKCRQLGISPLINGKENIIKRIITKLEG